MRKLSSCGLALIVVGALTNSASASWHMTWGGWDFDYGVYDHSGLEIRFLQRQLDDGTFEPVIFQMNFPVLRVDYAPGHCNESPFSDQLVWPKLLPLHFPKTTTAPLSVETNWCDHKVCSRSFTVGDTNWLEIGVAGIEGNYIIYQAWYLSDKGHILARAYSKGAQCPNATHRHHPYWRFDIDMMNQSQNSVFQHDDNIYPGVPPPDVGFGPGMTVFTTEANAVKDAFVHRVWFQQDDITKHGVWVVPGHVNNRDDGVADLFSNRDLSVVRWSPTETEGPWTDHKQGKIELPFTNGENVRSDDDVLWYVAHFQHDEPQGSYVGNCSGDPGFPSVFKLRSGQNCNDVFGAGPTLIVVQKPEDQGPVAPFDYDVELHAAADECGIGAGPGNTEHFYALVKGVPVGDQPTYSWSLSGLVATAVGPSNQAGFDVLLSLYPVTVTVKVTLLGLTKTASLIYTPETAQSIQAKQLRCTVLKQTSVNSFINALWDPLRDLNTHPYTGQELRQIIAIAQRVLQFAQNLLAGSPPSTGQIQ